MLKKSSRKQSAVFTELALRSRTALSTCSNSSDWWRSESEPVIGLHVSVLWLADMSVFLCSVQLYAESSCVQQCRQCSVVLWAQQGWIWLTGLRYNIKLIYYYLFIKYVPGTICGQLIGFLWSAYRSTRPIYICMTLKISINKQNLYKNVTGYFIIANIYCHNLNLTQLHLELGVLTHLSVHAQPPWTP